MEGGEIDKKTIRDSTTMEELFGIIEFAIEVAATKYPQEFSNRKSKVVELLSAPSSLINTDHALPTNINNIEEPAQKKRPLLKLKMGRIIHKVCDKQSMEESVINISPATVTTHQEVIKKEDINNKDLRLENSKRKLAERYMEAKKARKTIQVLELCDLPQKQDFSVKVPPKPRTFRRTL